MEDITENSSGEKSVSVETPDISLGKMLRDARERLGLSVMDVAGQIKFAPRQIEALEADDFQHLPEAAFLRGFVRSYAKILHVDAQILLAALPQKKTVPGDLIPDSVGEQFPNAHSLQRQNFIWLSAALLLIIFVAGFAFWHFTTPPELVQTAQVESPVSLPADIQITTPVQPDQPVPEVFITEPVESKAQASVQSSVTAANTVSPRLVQRNQAVKSDIQSDTLSPITSLRLEFGEESWAEIKNKDGKILSSRIHAAGSELRINGHAPLSLLIGRASSVRLYYQDKQVDLAPHTRRSTDVASLTLE